MPHSQPSQTRSLPAKPNLRQLRKQAKELLKEYQSGQAAAVAEVACFEPADPAKFVLVDAQRILARAYGFLSWAKLKQHVDGVNVETFCEAVVAGDIDTVRRLAQTRPGLVHLPRGGDFGERIALHFAVLNRDPETTRLLMELGSDANKGFWPYRDATTAKAMASDRQYDEILEIIQQGELRQRRDQSSPGAAIGTQTEEIFQAILDERWDAARHILERDLSLVGACDVHGVSPLHVAARTHQPEVVEWLLDRQAPVNAKAPSDVYPHANAPTKSSGYTPLDYAAIIAGWPANERYYGWSANDDRFPYLENARIEPERFQKTMRSLLANGADLTPRAAVAIDDRQAVKQMHGDGRLINEVHFLRGGLLAIAARVNLLDMVALLLDLGLDPDEPARAESELSWGFPLWFATMCGRYEIAELLLTRGADVNAMVYASGDSLCNAEATRDARMKTLLLKYGARVTVEHVAGNEDRETARAILEGRASAQSLNVDEPSHSQLAEQLLWAAGGKDAEIIRMCLPYITRELDDPWWAYVLMHATLPECFELVLNHGVDPDVAEGGDPTPLHHIATDYVKEEHRPTFAKLLLDAGASLGSRDALLHSTPLGWACRYGRLKLAEFYLARGADALEDAAEPWARPLAWAEKGGHSAIVDLLRSQ